MIDAPRIASLDTSFLIRLLSEGDELHEIAVRYFRHMVENDFVLLCSTVAIAEYCVRGKIEELPLENLQILPFELNHAVRAGTLANIAFQMKTVVSDRRIIPNDCKLMAQADVEGAGFYLTSDARSKNLYETLRQSAGLTFSFVDIREANVDVLG